MTTPVLLPAPSFPASPADPDPETPYEQYVYAYPHQKAYRLLEDGPLLSDLWSGERLDALSLYAHIPFCEMRCGFCNLFTRTGAPEEVTGAFLATLERQARVTREALEAKGEPIRFTLAAFGGGTPTYLTADELTRLCDISENVMGADLKAASWSVETSPATATADRIAVLAERGATRLSIGVQSFVDEEARAAVRPQKRAEVEASSPASRRPGSRSSTSTSSTASTARPSAPSGSRWTPPSPGRRRRSTSTRCTCAR